MKPSLSLLVALAAFAAPVEAQQVRDMTVLRVGGTGSGDFRFYGTTGGGMRAYSIATTSCNEGNVQLPWIAEEVHIAQNLFRIGEGRVEQLGYSWLKLGFCAINEPGCGSCQGTPCDTLGVGCADTYTSGLNDGRFGHSKADVNPTTGTFIQAASSPTGGTHRGRLKVDENLMGLANYRYIAEGQYVYEGDIAQGNHRNNVTWREVNTTSGSGAMNGNGHANQLYQCAVDAWAQMQPGVSVTDMVNTDEPTQVGNGFGYYVLGYAVTSLGNGSFRYEYAVQNLTSDQGGASFSLPFGCGVNVSDVYFKGVDHHSGEVWDDTAWNFTQTSTELRWEVPETFGMNPNASAIRWGELFNFGFTADAPPVTTTATLGLFKPGNNSALTAGVRGPCAECTAVTSNYCSTSANSFGSGAIMGSSGTPSVAVNNFSLEASGAVPGQFGLFYYGAGQAASAFGEGTRCVSDGGVGIFRLNPPSMPDGAGDISRMVDFTSGVSGTGAGAITGGSTWNFQLWYRDPMGGGTGFNLSDGLSVTFCP